MASLFPTLLPGLSPDPRFRQLRDARPAGARTIYVLRHASIADAFALAELLRREGLPPLGFVNELPPWAAWSVLGKAARRGLGALGMLTKPKDTRKALAKALERGDSVALFLKRPAHLLEASTRGRIESDEHLAEIFDAVRGGLNVVLEPHVFIWSRHPDSHEKTAVDSVFGSREWPGATRATVQLALHGRHVNHRVGEAIVLSTFVNEHREANESTLRRRLVYALLTRLERERRSVLGPTEKPRDRVRHEILRSPKLARVIRDLAGEGEAEQRALRGRAQAMLIELEASLDMNTMAALSQVFDATFGHMFRAFEVDQPGLDRLREAARSGTLIILPCHKSHADYIILTRMFYRANMPVPVIAAGDNLDFFPIGTILRRAGAFFIRRQFGGDKLYTAVVDAYIRRLLKEGRPLEFYLEGARSRTGKSLAPKLGILSMVVDAALAASDAPVYFCPVSLGYERLVEERSFQREKLGVPKEREDFRALSRALRLVFSQFGRVSVNFGAPIALSEALGEVSREVGVPLDPRALTPPIRRKLVQRLGFRVMHAIAAATPVTAGALVALVVLDNAGPGIHHSELLDGARHWAKFLLARGARFSPALLAAGSTDVREEAIVEACTLFLRAGHLTLRGADAKQENKEARASTEATYAATEDGRVILDVAKNSIVHFFVEPALVAIAAASHPAGMLDDVALHARVKTLSRLFKYEFSFQTEQDFEAVVEQNMADLTAEGALVRGGDATRTNPTIAAAYTAKLRTFLEGYRILGRTIAEHYGPSTPSELAKRALAVGDRMFLRGEVSRRESVSRPMFETAISAFVDLGFLERREGRVALAAAYASDDARTTPERRIAAFLHMTVAPPPTDPVLFGT